MWPFRGFEGTETHKHPCLQGFQSSRGHTPLWLWVGNKCASIFVCRTTRQQLSPTDNRTCPWKGFRTLSQIPSCPPWTALTLQTLSRWLSLHSQHPTIGTFPPFSELGVKKIGKKMIGNWNTYIDIPLDSWRHALSLWKRKELKKSRVGVQTSSRFTPTISQHSLPSKHPETSSQRVFKVELEVRPSQPSNRMWCHLSTSWRKLCKALIMLGKKPGREGYSVTPPKENLPIWVGSHGETGAVFLSWCSAGKWQLWCLSFAT